jgi:hypothetical protein
MSRQLAGFMLTLAAIAALGAIPAYAEEVKSSGKFLS